MMFDCAEARRYVDAWIDEELDPAAALHVESHVSRCANCRREADGIRAVTRSFAALREQDAAPARLRLRLAPALDAEDQAVEQAAGSEFESPAQQEKRRRHARIFAIASAALAGIVFVAGKHTAARSEQDSQQ